MSALKPGLAVLVILLGFSGSAQAQYAVAGGYGFAGYPGASTNLGYYSINGGFGNYGLPGTYPNYRGYGLSGYGPGSNLGGYFTNPSAPKVSNNMGGLMNAIQRSTGKPGSYRTNSSYGVSNRRVR